MSNKEWGKACWYVFHTLAYRLLPTKEHLVDQLLNHIRNVSCNLPCPDCSQHARQMFDTLKSGSVNNRETLIEMLYQMHNRVNLRIKKETITRAEHDELYLKANIVMIVKYFQYVMTRQLGQEKAMIYTMARRNAVNALVKFYVENQDSFA
jgi:hypothetical protein